MSEKFGLSPETHRKIADVLSRFPQINRVILYGSRAKGNFKPGSDIDLTLDAPSLTLSDLLHIENQIDDLLLPQKVDLSLLHQIDQPQMLDHIKRVGISFL